MKNKKLENLLRGIPVVGDTIEGYDTYQFNKTLPDDYKWECQLAFWQSAGTRWFRALIIAGLIGGAVSLYEMQRYVSLKNRAEQVADINHDGRLDNQESINFYHSIGMPFRTETTTEVVPTQAQFNQDNLRDYIKQYEHK